MINSDTNERIIKRIWLQTHIQELKDLVNANNLLIESYKAINDPQAKNLERINQYLLFIMHSYNMELSKT